MPAIQIRWRPASGHSSKKPSTFSPSRSDSPRARASAVLARSTTTEWRDGGAHRQTAPCLVVDLTHHERSGSTHRQRPQDKAMPRPHVVNNQSVENGLDVFAAPKTPKGKRPPGMRDRHSNGALLSSGCARARLPST